MIEPGDGWKFRNHLTDYTLFEDQVLEHAVVGHQVVRRVFGPKLQEDELAFEAVKRQAAASAIVEHWGYPSLLMSEVVEGHYCLLYEHIEGETLEAQTNRRAFAEVEAWADVGLDLVRLFEDFQNHGIAFDHARMNNIIVKRRLVRVISRWPVSLKANENADDSRWIQRLDDSQVGGVYVAEGKYPAAQGMARVKDLLFGMATAQSARTVAATLQALQIKEKEVGVRGFSQLQLPAPVEQIMLRLHNVNDSRAITSFDELKSELGKLCPARNVSVGEALDKANRTPAKPEATIAASEELAPQPKAAAESRTVPAPAAARRVEMVGRETMDSDAEEDRSFLYPTAPSSSASGGTAPNTSVLISKPGSPGAKRRSRSRQAGKKLVLVAGAIILALVVLGAGYFGWVVTKSENQRPIAAFEKLPTTVRTMEPVRLDAGPSMDPEGAELSYTWEIPSLGTTDYRIRPNKSTEAREAELEVFLSGEYTVRLRVFDQQNFSDPATQQIEVLPQEPRR